MARVKQTTLKTKKYQVILVKFYWLIIIVVFLIALMVEYFLIIKPKLEQTVEGRPLDIQSRQEILIEQKEYYEKLKSLKVEADEVNIAELEKVDYVLAKQIDVPNILNQINVLTQSQDLKIINFDFSFEKGVIVMSFRFKGGTYQTVKQYLEMLEKNIRIMDVVNINMTDIGNNFTIKIHSYYLE